MNNLLIGTEDTPVNTRLDTENRQSSHGGFDSLMSKDAFLQIYREFEERATGALLRIIPLELHQQARNWRTTIQDHADYHTETDDLGQRSLLAHLALMGEHVKTAIDEHQLSTSDALLIQLTWLAHDSRMLECLTKNPDTGANMYPKHAEIAAEDAATWANFHQLADTDTQILKWLIGQHMNAHQGEKLGKSATRLAIYQKLPEEHRERGITLLNIFQGIDAKSTLVPEGKDATRVQPPGCLLEDYHRLLAAEKIEKDMKAHKGFISGIVMPCLTAAGITDGRRIGGIMAQVATQFPFSSNGERPGREAILDFAKSLIQQ
jgi:hypothetical protein